MLPAYVKTATRSKATKAQDIDQAPVQCSTTLLGVNTTREYGQISFRAGLGLSDCFIDALRAEWQLRSTIARHLRNIVDSVKSLRPELLIEVYSSLSRSVSQRSSHYPTT